MLSKFTIQNDHLTVSIKKQGAELCSVINKKGTEYIWQAGEVWPRHAPNLFPIVGSLLDHQFIYDGTTYDLTHHGFARNMEFDMLHQSEHSICLVLQQNEDTLKSYPFHFTLLITYTLQDNSLTQRFRVINTDTKEVLTSFGGHPAFNASPVEDFEITFDTVETAPSNKLEGPYINAETYPIINHNKIPLTRHTFDDDALIFQNLKSAWIHLRHTKSNYQVSMRINEFPYLGIWAKPGAPYVCLEPWQGLADHTSHDKQLKSKLGIIPIPVGGEVQKEFEMVFSPAW